MSETLEGVGVARALSATREGLWRARLRQGLKAAGQSLACLTLPIAGGLALVWPFFSETQLWLLFVGLVPWALAWRQTRFVLEAYLGVFLGGLAFHLLGADSLRTIGGTDDFLGPHAATWLVTGVFGASFWTWSLCLARTVFPGSRLPWTLTLPLVWVAQEYWRRRSPELLFETPFPWLQLGGPLSDVPVLVQIADLAGVWGLSFLVAAVNGYWLDIVEFSCGDRWRGRRTAAVVRHTGLAGAILAALLVYGHARLRVPLVKNGPGVVLVPIGSRPGPGLVDELRARSLDDANLYLWAESSLQEHLSDVDLAGRGSMGRAMIATSQALNATLFVGCNRDSGGFAYRSTVVAQPDSTTLSLYDKVCLVPWSEFTPRLALSGWVAESERLTPGQTCPNWQLTNGPGLRCRAASAICYDVCFPQLIARALGDPSSGPPDLFCVSSSEAADRSRSLARQMLWMVRCRAVECRRPFVRNVLGGYSGLVDSRGTYFPAGKGLRLPWPERVVPIKLDGRRTLYQLAGDWLPWAGTLYLVLGIAKCASDGRRRGTSRPASTSTVPSGIR